MKNLFPRRHYLLTGSLLILLFTQCGKHTPDDPQPAVPPPTLPPVTQTGQNTVGFLLDGEVWVPAATRYPLSSASYYKQGFGFLCNREAVQHTTLYLLRENVTAVGTYELSPATGPKEKVLSYVINLSPTEIDLYTVDSQHTGSLRITRFDTINKIVAGEFAGELVNASGKTIKITQGRFDLRYF